jgi:hypothetical protein
MVDSVESAVDRGYRLKMTHCVIGVLWEVLIDLIVNIDTTPTIDAPPLLYIA